MFDGSLIPLNAFNETAATDFCDHSPVPCASAAAGGDCRIRQLQQLWNGNASVANHNGEHKENPLLHALLEAGCPQARAIFLIHEEGRDMNAAPALLGAYRAEKHAMSLSENQASLGYAVCQQCKPSTNTFAWYRAYGPSSACHRVTIQDSQSDDLSDADQGVLCIGRNGVLNYCEPGEFLAVSHVWSHGWQGVREDGICSRVLDMLLWVAEQQGVSYIWLDVAIISAEKTLRAAAINSMNRIYSSAKLTLICDRLMILLNTKNDRERALALAASDWWKRLWTMQEAFLSPRMLILNQDVGRSWRPRRVWRRLALDPPPDQAWASWGAIRCLASIMTQPSKDSMLDRVILSSRYRTTSHEVDLVRALFPLFDLTWPGHGTTLEQGQILLLQKLGNQASRLAHVVGPLGLPHPFSWAPKTLTGTVGPLGVPSARQTSSGLEGVFGNCEVDVLTYVPTRRNTNIPPPQNEPQHISALPEQVKNAFVNGTVGRFRLNSGQGLRRTLLDIVHDNIPGTTKDSEDSTEGRGTTLDTLKTSLLMDVMNIVGTHNATSETMKAHEESSEELGTMEEYAHKFDNNLCLVTLRASHAHQQCSGVLVHPMAKPYPWDKKKLMVLEAEGQPDGKRSSFTYSLVTIEGEKDGVMMLQKVGALHSAYSLPVTKQGKGVQAILS